MENLHIDFFRIDYECPYCGLVEWDCDEKLYNKCYKNKCGWTKVKCACGKTYGFTYNMKGDAVAFKI